MTILINNKKEMSRNVVFNSSLHSSAIIYDLLFLFISIVAPKMMRTFESKAAMMMALSEDGPKQRIPLTVSYRTRNTALEILPGQLI